MTGKNEGIISRLFAPELRAWRGEMRLGVVFWIYGVICSNFLLLLQARELALRRWALLEALIFFSVVYTAWILVAIWRCAETTEPFWGTLARWLAIAWGLNAAFVIFFFQIELLMRFVAS